MLWASPPQTSLKKNYFRMSHHLRRESGGIFCTFIPEGRMFTMLERLNSTTNKGKDQMVTSDSFVLEIRNGSKDTFDLLATRSCTRLVCLDLGGASNSFWKRSSRHETRNFSTRFLYPLDHKLNTRLGSLDGALIHTPRRRRVWKHLEWVQG